MQYVTLVEQVDLHQEVCNTLRALQHTPPAKTDFGGFNDQGVPERIYSVKR